MCCCGANHRLFSICLPLNIYILQHRGIATCCGDNVCVMSAVLTSAIMFHVLHVCVRICQSGLVSTVYVLNCIHNQILALDTNIFASVFQFLVLLGSDATQAFLYTEMLSPESTWNNQGFLPYILRSTSMY